MRQFLYGLLFVALSMPAFAADPVVSGVASFNCTSPGANGACPAKPNSPTNPSYVASTGGGAKTVLTSSSPTACTSLSATAGTLVSIINTGAATTVFFALYDEAASPTCAAADLIYGDGTTLTLLAGQVITLGIPLANGLSYQISGALSGNLIVVRN